MNIAFILRKFPVTSQTFVHRQIDALIAAGHSVSVIAQPTVDASNAATADALEVYPLPITETGRATRVKNLALFVLSSALRHPSKVTGYIAEAAKFVTGPRHDRVFSTSIALLGEAKKFDVICCHFGYNGADAVLLKEAGVLSGKLVTIFHGFDVTSYLDKNPMAYDQLKDEGDLFLCVNAMFEVKLKKMGFPPEKLRVHHMGVACSQIDYGFTPLDNSVRLTSVCRFVEKKGISYALQALPKVVKQFPNLTYTLIGDGPLRAELEAEVTRLSLTSNVKFLGSQTNEVVFETLRKTHVFLAPSVTAANGDMEGIPVVIMEAMAQGTPVLSTYHSGIPELIEHGVSGYLAPERDSDAISKGLLELLSSDERLESVSKEARTKVERDFNNDLLDKQFVRLISEL